MARVVKGFMLGTHDDLTFYLMDGNLYVRLKSSLSRKKVKYSPRFVRTMQSAGELGRASKIASRVYRELSREQKKMVYVLYKKMTGVAKLALKYGKSEGEAEREVREYLVRIGVVKPVVEKEQKKVVVKEKIKPVKRAVRQMGEPRVFAVPGYSGRMEWKRRRKAVGFQEQGGVSHSRQRVLLFDG